MTPATPDENDGMFSFGTIADTVHEVIPITDESFLQLPFNPFKFDKTLRLLVSRPNLEPIGVEYPIEAGSTTVFGRKKKVASPEKQPLGPCHALIASTISEQHFKVAEADFLTDMGSKRGTYIWVRHNEPLRIESGLRLLLSGTIEIQFELEDSSGLLAMTVRQALNEPRTIPLPFGRPCLTIGSHPSCIFAVPGLQEYHLTLNTAAMTLHNLLEDDDYARDWGCWRQCKPLGDPIHEGDLILAAPYVYRVTL